MKGKTMKQYLNQWRSSQREEAPIPLQFEPRDLGCYRGLSCSLCALILTLVACAAWAIPLQYVVPNNLANAEGNSSSSDLLRTAASTFQQVYSASEFGFAPTNRIDAISFRMDGETGQSFVGTWNASVFLSTTLRSPDSLSPAYGDNAGPDSVQVFGGRFLIWATNTPGLRAFQVRIPFETPFFYDPTRGNLEVAIVTSAGPKDLVLDAQLAANDSVGRVFGGISTSGSVDSLGLVTEFEITPVPEPSFGIFIVAFGIIVLFAGRNGRWKKSSTPRS
jgi:hypothetical protein